MVTADPPSKSVTLPPTPEPIYIMDAVDLFTTGSDEAKIDYLVSMSAEDYPIQVGAFRLKSNAERFYGKISEILGKGVTILEEDGYYKIRVAGLSRDRIASLTGKPDEPAQVPDAPRAILLSFKTDTGTIIPGSPDTVREMAALQESNPPVQEQSQTSDTTVTAGQAKSPLGRLFILNVNSPWLERINYFGKSFAFVNVLIITIAICIFMMIVLLAVILFNRTRMEREEKLKQYLAETYQSMIIDYLFTGSSPDKFLEIASDNYRRQALIDQMIDVSVNLKGDAEEKLRNLYLYLGLDSDSIKRAHDYRWHKKIKGFRELAFMNIKDANFTIYKALNSKNDILRMEAQIALVRLSEKDPFGFLFELKKPFSLWEQITLHELIIQHDLPVPSFKKWLRASNPTVVMFALRMIKEFKQRDAEDDVREIIEHPSPKVRRLAIHVAGDLEMRSTLESMKRIYKEQDYHTCIEIIRAMAKMPDTSLMGFLKLVLDKEDDVQLQIEATKAIENNGEEGVKTLVKLMKSEYKNYNIIVRHVLDRRIY
jgi:HEAT repeat protein